jgi:hypothetical protein
MTNPDHAVDPTVNRRKYLVVRENAKSPDVVGPITHASDKLYSIARFDVTPGYVGFEESPRCAAASNSARNPICYRDLLNQNFRRSLDLTGYVTQPEQSFCPKRCTMFAGQLALLPPPLLDERTVPTERRCI